MSREQRWRTLLVSGGEMVVSFQQTEPGSEQGRFAGPVSLLGVGGVAVLFVPGSVPSSEPSGGVETVQDVTGSGKIQLDSGGGRNGNRR